MNLTLRLPEELYKKLKEVAFEEDRSINGEINYMIKKYIEYKEKEKNLDKNNVYQN